jgi:hypothetical protein
VVRSQRIASRHHCRDIGRAGATGESEAVIGIASDGRFELEDTEFCAGSHSLISNYFVLLRCNCIVKMHEKVLVWTVANMHNAHGNVGKRLGGPSNRLGTHLLEDFGI